MAPTKPPSGVLERGLLVLSLFSMERQRLPLRDVAELSGLDKATALRLLRILVAQGFLEKGSDGTYSPGPANLRLASVFRVTSNFITRLEAPIARISKRVGQSTAFYVRSGNDRTCLTRQNVFNDFTHFIDVGASVPLAKGGASAKLLLAYTEPDTEAYRDIRDRGYYLSRGERNKHLCSIALPVFESDGSFLGNVMVAGMAVELDDETLVSFIGAISEELETAGFRCSD